MYLLGAILPSEKGEVRKYDSKGTLLLKYSVPVQLLDRYSKYIGTIRNLSEEALEILEPTISVNTFRELLRLKIIHGEVVVNNVVLGTTNIEYPKKQRIAEPRIELTNAKSGAKKQQTALIIHHDTNDTIKVELPCGLYNYSAPTILKTDSNMNLYLTRWFHTEAGCNEELLIYNRNGILVSIIPVRLKEKYDWVYYDCFRVSDAGAVYTWENDESGVKIIQFIKQ